MAAVKMEAAITFERLEIAISTATPTFSAKSDLDMTLSALPDISRCWPTTEFKLAATETGSGNNYWVQSAGDTSQTAIPSHGLFDHA